VACRAAVYAALVPADRWVKDVNVRNAEGRDVEALRNGTKKGLNRRHAKEFVERMCQYPGEPRVIAEAQRHILGAHADRLNAELQAAKAAGKVPDWVTQCKLAADRVTVDDIIAGRAPRPRVLDLFAGGAAIPLEALRLGCDAHALDLNPVAHIIQLCCLVYPQKFGKVDPAAPGMTGPKNKTTTTWGGLAEEVRFWGNWVRDKVKTNIGDLYAPIPDPELCKSGKTAQRSEQTTGEQGSIWESEGRIPPGHLLPIAYLWTRTVRCKNLACGATVPLFRQTWLCKHDARYVAIKPVVIAKEKQVRFEVVEAASENGLGFDPEGFSKSGNATCFCCGAVADIDYVKQEGWAGRIAFQLLAAACTKPGARGKVYLSPKHASEHAEYEIEAIVKRAQAAARKANICIPDEPIAGLSDDCQDNTLGITVRPYGLRHFSDLFTPRQLLCLVNIAGAIHQAVDEMGRNGYSPEQSRAVAAYLAAALDREAENESSVCRWNPNAEKMQGTFGRQVITMVWDFCEVNPFGGSVGDWSSLIDLEVNAIEGAILTGQRPATVMRGSATAVPMAAGTVDAVITDPPYYDNVPYADISDFFYVWLKRSIGHLHSEHFATTGTPKKAEAIADANRHGGDWDKAKSAYEQMMLLSFREANRVLKADGILVVVYAHKTTLGWSTLVDSMRQAGFMVTEAWPLDTEMKSRLRGMDSAALASSIFLVGRKRDSLDGGSAKTGNYEDEVQPKLQQIVRERVDTLWEMGIAGADLVIACVGAGLRAFTKYEKVEYANGEEVPAEKFLAEVEGVVLDTMMGKLSGVTGGNVAAVDPASRFYVLWRFVYKAAELDAGEAIVFANGTHIELDGPHGLSSGRHALVEKKKAKYRARDYTERGNDAKLGIVAENGQSAPLIDALHRILWLMENGPRKLGEFLDEARPDRERLRILGQALAGAALSGKSEEEAAKLVSTTPAEQAALGKLLANWRSLIESRMAVDEETLFGKRS
jgi:putative DNA methylase